MRYRIYMNNGEVFTINREKMDWDEIAKARWMEIDIPITTNASRKAYLNVAQINRIEVID